MSGILERSNFITLHSFFYYFRQHKATVFKESMIKPICMKAGLGDSPAEYHNYSPECINSVIKIKVNHKKSLLDDFCNKMKSLVDDQQNLLIQAVTSRGEYRLHPVFKDFEMSHLEWFALPETDCANHIKKLRSAAFKRINMLKSSNEPSLLGTVPDSPGHSSPESYEEAIHKCTNIPKTTLEHILKKAKHILSDENAVTTAPIKGIARMLKSKSHPNRPHIVRVLQKGKIVCDENCEMWTLLKMCSHCVAVAVKLNCLDDFVEWFMCNVKELNLTKLTTNNVPRNVGKKLNRRYSKQKVKLPVSSRVPLTQSSPSSSGSQTTPLVTDKPMSSSTLIMIVCHH